METVVTGWTRAIDAVASTPGVSIAVGLDDHILYAHAGDVARAPASGQKLLTSMAALEVFGPAYRFPTIAGAARAPRGGTVHGDLWLVGSGDPELGATRLAALAGSLRDAGIVRISGSVLGDTSTFSRRWWAPGWVKGISRSYVTRPTALAFEGNGSSIPELTAAASFASALERHGVAVEGSAGTGEAPARLRELAVVRSAPLRDLLARQNHGSINLYAEILMRALGARLGGAGTTSAGSEATERWAADAGVTIRVRDGSGLSHRNAVSAVDLVSLLLASSEEPWGSALRASLPLAGEGTLDGRLIGTPIRAKTGTLFTVPCSTLTGYVRDATGQLVAFAVLSEGIGKDESIAIEDEVARILATSRFA